MTAPGTSENPLRVAVVGSGPAGFYAAEKLLKAAGVVAEVEMSIGCRLRGAWSAPGWPRIIRA
jgi:flavin-dependent dehydrogenase